MASGDSGGGERNPKCIFCQIPIDEQQKVLDQTEELYVIEDIAPHAKHHLLVIPKRHVGNPKTLRSQHSEMVKEMITLGKKVLRNRVDSEPDWKESRLGFHWPPMNSIEHLHLHVFYPLSSMSFLCRKFIFNPGILFVTPDYLLERIAKLPSGTPSKV